MERRSFVQASLASVGALAATPAFGDNTEQKTGELYEIRVYQLKAVKQELLDNYLSKAFLPALKRYGIGPVGVFIEKVGTDALKVHVLIVHHSAEQFATLSARLAADEEHCKAAEAYLSTRANDPVYQRVESSLIAAMEGMPKLEKPDVSKPRLLNLRVYESHNERAGKKKIEMFNKGEIAIFRRVGLTPVFFGETILGSSMPNLTYLLVFPHEAGVKEAWNRFRTDADWEKLKAIPEYADKEIVSRITNKLLTPTAYSEI